MSKKADPEEILLRVLRVAEIVASSTLINQIIQVSQNSKIKNSKELLPKNTDA